MTKNKKNRLVERLKPRVINPYGQNMLITGQESATFKWLLEIGFQVAENMATNIEKIKSEGGQVNPDEQTSLLTLSMDLDNLKNKVERLYPTPKDQILVDTTVNISKEK